MKINFNLLDYILLIISSIVLALPIFIPELNFSWLPFVSQTILLIAIFHLLRSNQNIHLETKENQDSHKELQNKTLNQLSDLDSALRDRINYVLNKIYENEGLIEKRISDTSNSLNNSILNLEDKFVKDIQILAKRLEGGRTTQTKNLLKNIKSQQESYSKIQLDSIESFFESFENYNYHLNDKLHQNYINLDQELKSIEKSIELNNSDYLVKLEDLKGRANLIVHELDDFRNANNTTNLEADQSRSEISTQLKFNLTQIEALTMQVEQRLSGELQLLTDNFLNTQRSNKEDYISIAKGIEDKTSYVIDQAINSISGELSSIISLSDEINANNLLKLQEGIAITSKENFNELSRSIYSANFDLKTVVLDRLSNTISSNSEEIISEINSLIKGLAYETEELRNSLVSKLNKLGVEVNTTIKDNTNYLLGSESKIIDFMNRSIGIIAEKQEQNLKLNKINLEHFSHLITDNIIQAYNSNQEVVKFKNFISQYEYFINSFEQFKYHLSEKIGSSDGKTLNLITAVSNVDKSLASQKENLEQVSSLISKSFALSEYISSEINKSTAKSDKNDKTLEDLKITSEIIQSKIDAVGSDVHAKITEKLETNYTNTMKLLNEYYDNNLNIVRNEMALVESLNNKFQQFNHETSPRLFSQLESLHKDLAGKYSWHSKNLYHQFEALFALQQSLQLKKELPPFNGWAIAPDFGKFIADYILDFEPDCVVSLGSGSSDIIVGRCLQLNQKGRLYSLEHEEEYYKKSKKLINEYNLNKEIDLLFTPIKQYKLDEQSWLWYDYAPNGKLKAIDLLIVDGPPGNIQKYARYPAVPLLLSKIPKGGKVFLDDGKREEEKMIAHMWEENFGFELEYIDNSKGAFILTKK